MKLIDLGSVFVETQGFASFNSVTCPVLENDIQLGKTAYKSNSGVESA